MSVSLPPAAEEIPLRKSQQAAENLALLWSLRMFANVQTRLGRGITFCAGVHLLCGCEDAGDVMRLRDLVPHRIRKRLAVVESWDIPREGLLFANCTKLADALELDRIDRELLLLGVLHAVYLCLQAAIAQTNDESEMATAETIGSAIGIDGVEISERLGPHGMLSRCSLMFLARSKGSSGTRINVCSDLRSLAYRDWRSLEDVIGFCATTAPSSRNSREDFLHLEKTVSRVHRYLERALAGRLAGVNILMHGAPGVGKTELARLLAQLLQATAFEAICENYSEQPMETWARLNAFKLAQRVLARTSRALLIFDELEDLFPAAAPWERTNRDSAGEAKAAMNRLLEENPVPTIWLANHTWQMDPAFLRRFDMVVEIEAPSRSVRLQMLNSRLKGLPVSDSWMAREAEVAELTPASIERAAKVIRLTGLQESRAIEQEFESLIDGPVEAKGMLIQRSNPESTVGYRLDLLNTSHDVGQLCRALRKRRTGRLLFHGEPGTGKTELARFLARELDMPLQVQRASDLLSRYLGETEKQMARAFRTAEREKAIFLLDEADSFLQSRTEARYSWEVAQVNELLTQMESFDGMFICATNFVDRLDRAAMRRFGIKIKFDPLTQAQREVMFTSTLREAPQRRATRRIAPEVRQRLQQLDGLTPGMFVAAAESFKLTGSPISQAALLTNLEEELTLMRQRRSRPIGFGAA